LSFFQKIVTGVAHAHAHQPPIYHLDLKPENVLIHDDAPVVGDFGICYIEDDQISFTKEGPRGSMYYCAPELRNPKIASGSRLPAADVYSLGKILYWLFTGDVYDGHEEEYSEDGGRRLVHLFPEHPHFAFVDELVASTVRRNCSERLPSATDLARHVEDRVKRIQRGGRVLDLRIPQHCLYCGTGHYRPAHEQIHTTGPRQVKFPNINDRKNPPQDSRQSIYGQQPIYNEMREVANPLFGFGGTAPGIPLILICDFCGNVQYFRFDLTTDGHGENWRP
jgi:serine/threonine protein kinase